MTSNQWEPLNLNKLAAVERAKRQNDQYVFDEFTDPRTGLKRMRLGRGSKVERLPPDIPKTDLYDINKDIGRRK